MYIIVYSEAKLNLIPPKPIRCPNIPTCRKCLSRKGLGGSRARAENIALLSLPSTQRRCVQCHCILLSLIRLGLLKKSKNKWDSYRTKYSMHYEEAGGSSRETEDPPEGWVYTDRLCLSYVKASGYIQIVSVLGADGQQIGPSVATSVDGHGEDDGEGNITWPNPGTIKGSQQSFCLKDECDEDRIGYEEYIPQMPPGSPQGPDPSGGYVDPPHVPYGRRMGFTRLPGFRYTPPSHVPVTYAYEYIWISYGYVKVMPCCQCDEEEVCKGEKNEFEWDIDVKGLDSGEGGILDQIEKILEKDLQHKACESGEGDGGGTAAMTSDDDQKVLEAVTLEWRRQLLFHPRRYS